MSHVPMDSNGFGRSNRNVDMKDVRVDVSKKN